MTFVHAWVGRCFIQIVLRYKQGPALWLVLAFFILLSQDKEVLPFSGCEGKKKPPQSIWINY